MDEIIEQVESLIARANIGVIVTMNGTDHHLINQLTRLKEALIKQKWQQHGVMQAEGSDGAQGAAVGNSAAGQSGSGGSRTIFHKDGTVSFIGKYDGPEG